MSVMPPVLTPSSGMRRPWIALLAMGVTFLAIGGFLGPYAVSYAPSEGTLSVALEGLFVVGAILVLASFLLRRFESDDDDD